jgi:protein-S-isoprenylcysteine O-methyltransferase Ste14
MTLRILGFMATLAVWNLALNSGHRFRILIATACTLAVYPTVWLSRKVLDRHPTIERSAWLTSVLHIILMVLFGIAAIESVQAYLRAPEWSIPVPREIGTTLLVVTSVVTIFTVLNLALSGLGAPFALALSKRLASRWMYAWTRNPMVLSALACLCSAAIYLQSLQFLLWVLIVVSPAWLFFLKMYEERELEIRFGKPYLEYKAATPFFWPRKPSIYGGTKASA